METGEIIAGKSGSRKYKGILPSAKKAATKTRRHKGFAFGKKVRHRSTETQKIHIQFSVFCTSGQFYFSS